MNSSVLKLTICCLLSLLLYQEQAKAQAYKPILKPGRMWVYTHFHSTDPPSLDIYHNYIVDTTETINNQDYYKVYGSIGFHQTLYVREDTTERMVYALSNHVDTEYVLFDFSLITLNNSTFSTYAESMSSIDLMPVNLAPFLYSTITWFGIEYNRYMCHEPINEMFFEYYEGLGGAQGIASASTGFFEIFYELKSVIDSGGVVVMGEPLSVMEVDHQSPILFWVNTDKILEIKTSDKSSELNSYRISNINGQVLRSGNLNPNQTQIELSAYASGLYFLHIALSNGEQKTEKFILN